MLTFLKILKLIHKTNIEVLIDGYNKVTYVHFIATSLDSTLFKSVCIEKVRLSILKIS